MGVHFSVDIVMGPIIGGWGTLLGPILGFLVMTPLGECTRWLTEVIKNTFHMTGLDRTSHDHLRTGARPRGAGSCRTGWSAFIRDVKNRKREKNIAEIENVTKTFGGLMALKDVNFALSEGQIKSIIGPNGAGKTTLFNVISGFSTPDSGKSGSRSAISGKAREGIAHVGIARTFQVVKPFNNLTVIENVLIGSLDVHGPVGGPGRGRGRSGPYRNGGQSGVAGAKADPRGPEAMELGRALQPGLSFSCSTR